jgi:Na+-driven multidrug efflux pump
MAWAYLMAFLPFFALAFAAAFFALAFPLPPPILNILVPQTEHVPDIALRPFFMVICFSPFISLFFLHFTQYACVTKVDQAKLK